MLQEWREREISVRVMALQTGKRLDRPPAQMALATDSALSLKTKGPDGCPARPPRYCTAGASVRPAWEDTTGLGFLLVSTRAPGLLVTAHAPCAVTCPASIR